jgi:hypothetical protein
MRIEVCRPLVETTRLKKEMASQEHGHRAASVGGMITSTIHELILLPVFFALMERTLRHDMLRLVDGKAANV